MRGSNLLASKSDLGPSYMRPNKLRGEIEYKLYAFLPGSINYGRHTARRALRTTKLARGQDEAREEDHRERHFVPSSQSLASLLYSRAA